LKPKLLGLKPMLLGLKPRPLPKLPKLRPLRPGIEVVLVLVEQAAPADAVNDTTNKTASKIQAVFFILSNVCLPIIYTPKLLLF
jgi:hypothetical protein